LSETPDSGDTALRSRVGRNYRQLPARKRRRENLLPAEIVF
jgi:hypothetical protein